MNIDLIKFRSAVDSINSVLSQQSDLSPQNEVVNVALTSLVDIVTKAPTCDSIAPIFTHVTTTGIVENLRSIAQQAEYLLEHHYATNLLQS